MLEMNASAKGGEKMNDEKISNYGSSCMNAQITSTFLGYEDHGHFTYEIYATACNGQYYIFGNYSLDNYDGEQKKRVGTADGLECITELLKTVGVDKWEDLKGQYVRIVPETPGKGRSVNMLAIGNLMSDQWFSLRDFFKTRG